MSYSNRARWSTIRSTAAAGIGAAYAVCGGPLTSPAVSVSFKNLTNGTVVVSTDGVNDMLILPTSTYEITDLRTNAPYETDYMLPIGTQFYVKDGPTDATTGTFYIQILELELV